MVSYVPSGSSLRDINAKTKVTAWAIIYSVPPDKPPKIRTVRTKFLKSISPRQLPKNNTKGT